MKLSVVIVNYNVEYFLEQCVLSVLKASEGLDTEIFMVDNASVDGSVKMVEERFPEVNVIANKDNVGFSKANNQAMRLSQAEYVLLLNPDTVIEEDTLKKCIDFMDSHPQAGGLGVKMVDGKGRFLPESKRGLPTPRVAFFKITGINRLFPSSKKINRYYLGHLDDNKTHEIEILSGAFMFMRNKALHEVGLLDEAFFMYGEDIDLSYRLILGGYKNYYLPETSIIHYKGESTKKGSLNYVFVFYNAMVIFAKKHFSSQNAQIFSKLINLAIWLRASWSVMVRVIKKMILPAFELAVLYGVFYSALQWYGQWQEINYQSELVKPELLTLSSIYILCNAINAGYRKPWRIWNFLASSILGGTVGLLLYSLLPLEMRFSRALVLISPLIAFTSILLIRFCLNGINKTHFPFRTDRSTTFGIIGSLSEYDRVKDLISQTKTINSEYVHFSIENDLEKIEKIDELVKVYDLDEIVFCTADLSSSEIIKLMSYSNNKSVDFKIAPPESMYIIGSNSIDRKGDLFILDVNSIAKESNKRKKRLFDLLASITLIILFPLIVFINRFNFKWLISVFKVLIGQKTIVGYALVDQPSEDLPKLKTGVIQPINQQVSDEVKSKMNVLYARDYKMRNDLFLLFKNITSLNS